MKKIVNIVFYKYFNEEGKQKQACIFYDDGTVEQVSYDEGIDACEEIVAEKKITSKDAFKEMINKDIVHVMSGKEFERRFSEFFAKTSEDALANEEQKPITYQKKKERQNQDNSDTANLENNQGIVPPIIIPSENETTTTENQSDGAGVPDESESVQTTENDSASSQSDDELPDDFISDEDIENNRDNRTAGNIPPIIIPSSETEVENTDENEENESETADEEQEETTQNDNARRTRNRPDDLEDVEEDEVDEDEDEDEDENEASASDDDLEDELGDIEEEQTEEKKGFFKKIIDKFKKNKIVKRITIGVIALATAAGIFSCAAHNTKDGQMLNSNIATESTNDGDNKVDDSGVLVQGDNSYYDNYSYDQLLQVTDSKPQKNAMEKLGSVVTTYNGDFASAHVESGKDIKTALTYDEMVALQQAYNDYSKKELQAYFNGADIRSTDLTRAYKSASLQLMGAYVIETNESKVDMSSLITTDEGKEFYNRYHTMFLEAKNATEKQDKLNKIKTFYDAVKKDFPITEDVRTEGISHSDSYSSITSYKLSVAPMIAAGEMMWQNLDQDLTLDDTSIDFLNDIGLCNYAEKTFERIETIALSGSEDEKNPLYEQYKNAVEKMLTEKGIAVIDDEHRDLTKLQAFQDAVNWHFKEDGSLEYSEETSYSTDSYQTVSTYSDSTTTYSEDESRESVSADEVPDDERERLENEINSEIDSENEQAKSDAEENAEENRQEMQEEEDQNADKIEEEVKQDDQQLQDDIDKANDTIDSNNSDQDTSNDQQVNEDDFHGTVDFDDDHSDSNGNLDDSVENITTSPSDDQTGQDLPDPNETGAKFDAQQDNSNTSSDSSSSSSDSSSSSTPEESVPSTSTDGGDVSNDGVYEYEVPAEEASPSNADLVNEYVESLANQDSSYESDYVYFK